MPHSRHSSPLHRSQQQPRPPRSAHPRSRGVKVKTDEDETETDGERRIYLNFEVYNGEHLKPTFIVDTLRQIDGVLRVDLV